MTASYDARGFPAPELDQPYPGAPMGAVWRRFWKKGFTFTGRASRSEYWKFMLIQIGVIIGFYAVILAGLIVTNGSDGAGAMAGVLGLLMMAWLLVTAIPGIALAIRRLHDANYPGTYYLFSLIPFVGSFILLILLAQASNPAGARFDDRPMPYGYPNPAGGWSGPPASPEPIGYRPDTLYGQPPTAYGQASAPYGQTAPYAQPPVPYGQSTPYAQPPAQYGHAEPTFAPAPAARTGAESWGYAGPSQPAGRWSAVLPDGRRFNVDRPVIVGREPASDPRYPGAALVAVDDSSVSNAHAVIELVDGRLRVTDLYSANGTRLITATGAVIALSAGQAQFASDVLRVGLGDYEIQLAEG